MANSVPPPVPDGHPTPLETLRRAAVLMRQRSNAATAERWEPSLWKNTLPIVESHGVFATLVAGTPSPSDESFANVAHIASWDPTVALAVADLLELAVTHQVAFTPIVRPRLIAIARAYLGEA